MLSKSILIVLLLTQGAAALTLTAQFDAQFYLQDETTAEDPATYAQTLPVDLEVFTNLETVSYRLSWDFEDVLFTPEGAPTPLYASSAGQVTPVADLAVQDHNQIWIYLDSATVAYSGGWEIRAGAVDGAVVSQATPGVITQETGSFTNLIFDNSGSEEVVSLEGFVPALQQPIATAGNGYSLQVDITSPYFLLNQVLVGDNNSDGVVDAADYTVWRDAAGPLVDRLTSYADWSSNYGAALPLGVAASPAPEPTALGLLAASLAALLGQARNRCASDSIAGA